MGPSPHLVGLRARALATLGAPGPLVVAGAPALAERVPPAAARRSALEVSVGQALSLDDLVDRLVAMGYERVPQVEERGDLSVRGGILDVYPSTADLPARIELFGDEVESMRAFSPFTQRTIRPITRLAALARRPSPAGPTWPTPLADPGLGRRRGGAAGAHRAPRRPSRGGRAPRGRGRRGRAGRPGGGRPPPLGRAAALDLAPPRGRPRSRPSTPWRRASPPASATEAEGELARLGRSGMRVVVAFARRGDMARAVARLERLRAGGAGAGRAAAGRARSA